MIEPSALQDYFSEIGRHLTAPARLVVIGSTVGMLHGQPERQTNDIDVLSPASNIDMTDMRQACEAAGIDFDPTEIEVNENRPYLQLITPGIVRIGDYKKEIRFARFGNLEVVHPPIENIIASKLLRCDERDLGDILFLRKKFSINLEDVERVINTFPVDKVETARENLVYLTFDIEESSVVEKPDGLHP